ncbi:MAG: methylisocitrate lyase, partial [Pirellulaceae bacterium]
MVVSQSAGSRFRQALQDEKPLQIVGTINAYCALMAQQAGYRAIYLSGAGVANASYGVPDLGITTINDVATDIERITAASDLPLLVDADTGWGHAFSIARTIRTFTRAGACGVHMEDQEAAKRCGHRPNKAIVETAEMVDRLHAAADARTDDDFFIMARTDALASEGLEATLERCHRYVEAGADGIFAEAVTEPEHYRQFCEDLPVPVLANMTEFGESPLLDPAELGDLGVDMVLYPLSAFRAMNLAAEHVYNTIRQSGTQRSLLDEMQTRQRLYEVLDYH